VICGVSSYRVRRISIAAQAPSWLLIWTRGERRQACDRLPCRTRLRRESALQAAFRTDWRRRRSGTRCSNPSSPLARIAPRPDHRTSRGVRTTRAQSGSGKAAGPKGRRAALTGVRGMRCGALEHRARGHDHTRQGLEVFRALRPHRRRCLSTVDGTTPDKMRQLRSPFV
jgi:hypothetical protein